MKEILWAALGIVAGFLLSALIDECKVTEADVLAYLDQQRQECLDSLDLDGPYQSPGGLTLPIDTANARKIVMNYRKYNTAFKHKLIRNIPGSSAQAVRSWTLSLDTLYKYYDSTEVRALKLYLAQHETTSGYYNSLVIAGMRYNIHGQLETYPAQMGPLATPTQVYMQYVAPCPSVCDSSANSLDF